MRLFLTSKRPLLRQPFNSPEHAQGALPLPDSIEKALPTIKFFLLNDHNMPVKAEAKKSTSKEPPAGCSVLLYCLFHILENQRHKLNALSVHQLGNLQGCMVH
jgi:hypothetical protein